MMKETNGADQQVSRERPPSRPMMLHDGRRRLGTECGRVSTPRRGACSLGYLGLFILLVTRLTLLTSEGTDLRDLKVLYVGNSRAQRASEFRAFLGTNVGQVAVAERDGFEPSCARNFDVVVMDWPQSERGGDSPPRKSPLGDWADWDTPTILLGSAWLHMVIVWDVKGGAG